MKELSCGVIVFNFGQILIGHPTGHPENRWNIPKGHIEEGEIEIECAIRELYEETNILVHKDQLSELGRFNYIPKKDLHLFYTTLHKRPLNIKCNSYYSTSDPEFDDFKFIDIDDIEKYCSKNLQRVLYSAIEQIGGNEKEI
jgi:8-oxo-dGTP pyrophosphatase MutT (NUDIX family)